METLKFNKEQLQFLWESTGNNIVEFYTDSNGDVMWRLLYHEESSSTIMETIKITLRGKKLLIDTENLEVDGKKYFTHDEAMDIAKSQGKRLLTREEYEELIKLPHKWDGEKSGMWIGELFFPAAGYRLTSGGGILNEGNYGCYWSSSVTGANGYILLFNHLGGIGASSYYDLRANGYSVRLVKEID